MNNVPEKHRAVAHAWVDGAEIQGRPYKDSVWQNDPPLWDASWEYRVRPRMVKAWRWVVRSSNRELYLTSWHYRDQEQFSRSNTGDFLVGAELVQRIDSTMIEVEE